MTKLLQVKRYSRNLRGHRGKIIEIHHFILTPVNGEELLFHCQEGMGFDKELVRLDKTKEWMYFDYDITDTGLKINSIRNPEAQLTQEKILNEEAD